MINWLWSQLISEKKEKEKAVATLKNEKRKVKEMM
jgi:hypothetical protein